MDDFYHVVRSGGGSVAAEEKLQTGGEAHRAHVVVECYIILRLLFADRIRACNFTFC